MALPNLNDFFTTLDISVLFVEYRGYGDTVGPPSLVRLYDDVEAIFRYLQTEESNLVVMGWSIGSLPAGSFSHLYVVSLLSVNICFVSVNTF
jgi:hypothetical protein